MTDIHAFDHRAPFLSASDGGRSHVQNVRRRIQTRSLNTAGTGVRGAGRTQEPMVDQILQDGTNLSFMV